MTAPESQSKLRLRILVSASDPAYGALASLTEQEQRRFAQTSLNMTALLLANLRQGDSTLGKELQDLMAAPAIKPPRKRGRPSKQSMEEGAIADPANPNTSVGTVEPLSKVDEVQAAPSNKPQKRKLPKSAMGLSQGW